MDKRDYSLRLLQSWFELKKNLQDVALQEIDLVRTTIDTDDLLRFEDYSGRFYFEITIPEQTIENKFIATTSRFPKNELSTKGSILKIEVQHVLEKFKSWIIIIDGYEKIPSSEDERILNQYSDEFFDNINIVDEDADTKAYDLNKQLLFLSYIDFVETQIDANDSVDAKDKEILLNETTVLKRDLSNLTKRKTIQRFSKLFARIRKSSLTLLKEIWIDVRKEAIKKLVNGGYENLDSITDIFK